VAGRGGRHWPQLTPSVPRLFVGGQVDGHGLTARCLPREQVNAAEENHASLTHPILPSSAIVNRRRYVAPCRVDLRSQRGST
jgi:hypothetical protein